MRTYVDLSEQSFGRNVFGYPINNGGRNFYYGNADDAAAANQVVRALDRIQVPGKRLLVGPDRPAQDALQRRVLLLPVPRARAGARTTSRWTRAMANATDSGLADEVATSD